MTQGVFCHKRPLYYISPCKAFAKSLKFCFSTPQSTQNQSIFYQYTNERTKNQRNTSEPEYEKKPIKKVTRNYCGCCCYCDCFASSCCYSCSCFMQQTLSATLPTDLLAQIHKKETMVAMMPDPLGFLQGFVIILLNFSLFLLQIFGHGYNTSLRLCCAMETKTLW